MLPQEQQLCSKSDKFFQFPTPRNFLDNKYLSNTAKWLLNKSSYIFGICLVWNVTHRISKIYYNIHTKLFYLINFLSTAAGMRSGLVTPPGIVFSHQWVSAFFAHTPKPPIVTKVTSLTAIQLNTIILYSLFVLNIQKNYNLNNKIY